MIGNWPKEICQTVTLPRLSKSSECALLWPRPRSTAIEPGPLVTRTPTKVLEGIPTTPPPFPCQTRPSKAACPRGSTRFRWRRCRLEEVTGRTVGSVESEVGVKWKSRSGDRRRRGEESMATNWRTGRMLAQQGSPSFRWKGVRRTQGTMETRDKVARRCRGASNRRWTFEKSVDRLQ